MDQAIMSLPVSEPRHYEPPIVVYEASLEIRAGSPLGLPDPMDLTSPQ